MNIDKIRIGCVRAILITVMMAFLSTVIICIAKIPLPISWEIYGFFPIFFKILIIFFKVEIVLVSFFGIFYGVSLLMFIIDGS